MFKLKQTCFSSLILARSVTEKMSIRQKLQKVKRKDLNVEETKQIELKTSKWEPEHWKEVLDNLRQMRKDTPAPVDTMGCHKCCDSDADPKTKRYQTLVALMLSSQTKDEVTFEAMKRLISKGLTAQSIMYSTENELEKILMPVSFYKNKAKFLIKTSRILDSEYDGDIPKTVEGLIKLPGVGPKMAHICMNSAWGIVTGIGVDTHVHRISNRLKWVQKETKQPENTRIELEKWIPYELWDEVNVLLVGFGQTICNPVSPKCDQCLNQDICPSAFKSKKKNK